MEEILTAKNLTKEYFVKTGKEPVKVINGINQYNRGRKSWLCRNEWGR